jgi:hypothetical protein
MNGEPFPNDFLVMDGLYSASELDRFYRAVNQLGYKIVRQAYQGHWHNYVEGLKPYSADAEALFQLAEIED